jgi:hypothetical protein
MAASDLLRKTIITELLALTGETPSKLWHWLERLKRLAKLERLERLERQLAFLQTPKSRSRFHSAWNKFALPREKQEKTRDCCLGSRPDNCQLRFRAARFSIADSDKRNDQGTKTYLILAGYEVCTSWLGYVLFDDDVALPESPVGLPVSKFIEFCQLAARSIGLPLSSIKLTNCFLLDENWQTLTDIRKVLGEPSKAGNLPCSFAMDDGAAMPETYTSDLIEKSFLTRNLLGQLDKFVNVHNENFAIPQIEIGRMAMHKLASSSKKNDDLSRPSANERRMMEPHIDEAILIGKLSVSSKLQKLS